MGESYRRLLNRQQTQLRQVMMRFDQHDQAMRLFMRQHAMLHSARMSHTEPWSLEDEILDDMTEEQMRRVPDGAEHSVAWCIWHIARIEDVTMNLLVADRAQVLRQDNWLERLRSPISDTGNAMEVPAVERFSAWIDVGALRAYRQAVGRRTREIVQLLPPEALRRKVDPVRVQRVLEQGAVMQAARGIIEYWSKRTIAGLLLMPASRHLLVHLNEASLLKRRRH